MRILTTCKTCGVPFTAVKETQHYCSRSCFKRSYYKQARETLKKELANPKYPKKFCSFCGHETQLTFDPIKNEKAFNDFQCPNCSVTNAMIWKNSGEANSQQIIRNIIITGTFTIN